MVEDRTYPSSKGVLRSVWTGRLNSACEDLHVMYEYEVATSVSWSHAPSCMPCHMERTMRRRFEGFRGAFRYIRHWLLRDGDLKAQGGHVLAKNPKLLTGGTW